MNDKINKSIWSGVFFPADQPEEMSLTEQNTMDAPVETEIVSTDFQVEREDISDESPVTNEVTETPEIIDESPSEEQKVDAETTENVEQSDEPVQTESISDNTQSTEE